MSTRGVLAATAAAAHPPHGGGFDGSVDVLTGGRSHASAHYVVNRDGRIMQLVHQSDIAWHAGNMAVNKESLGIEHVGMTYDPAGFPRAE